MAKNNVMREPGYYWVRLERPYYDGDAIYLIAAWDGYHWTLNGSQYEYDDKFWTEIDERRIERQPECKDDPLKGAKLFWVKKKNWNAIVKHNNG